MEDLVKRKVNTKKKRNHQMAKMSRILIGVRKLEELDLNRPSLIRRMPMEMLYSRARIALMWRRRVVLLLSELILECSPANITMRSN